MKIKSTTLPKKFTKKNMLAWARKLPDNKAFNYVDGRKCAFASFLKTLTLKRVTVGPSHIFLNGVLIDAPDWTREVDMKFAMCGFVSKKDVLDALK